MSTDNTYKTRHVVFFLLLAVCIWFLAAYLDKTAHAKLYFDSGWHATVAKNLANGRGYASSYNGYRYFDPDVTMGPVPIVLASVSMAFFGNTYILPIYVASLLHLVLAIAIVAGVYRIANGRSAIFMGLSLALLLSYFEPRWWHIFTSDMSSMLWGILGLQLAVIGVQTGRNKILLAAGFVAGLAVLSKAVGIVMLAGAGAYVVIARLRDPATLAGHVLSLALGVAICLGPWQIYKAVAEVGPVPSDAADTALVQRPLERRLVGIVQLWKAPDKFAHVRQAATISKKMYSQKLGEYGLPAFSYLLLFGASLALAIYAMFTLDRQRNHLLLALALTATGFWVWHVMLSVALGVKYTLYPLFTSFVLILYWLSTSRLPWLAPVSLIAWIILGPATARAEVYRFYGFGYEDDVYRENLEAVAAELTRPGRYTSGAPLAACGWVTIPWPLEYILPDSNNFVDCYERIRQAMVRDDRSGNYRWRDDVDLSFTLVIETNLWIVDKLNPDKNAVMFDICGANKLYENPDFRIVECRDEDIRARIVPAADSPFLQQRRPGDARVRRKVRQESPRPSG